MNHLVTPAFIFDPNDPGTSPGFLLVFRLPRHTRDLGQFRFQTLDFLCGGHADGCLAVLFIGATEQPSFNQAEQRRELSRQWGVAVDTVDSTDAVVRLGTWLLSQLHQIFHQNCEQASFTPLQLACVRQMTCDAIEEFTRRPMRIPTLALAA